MQANVIAVDGLRSFNSYNSNNQAREFFVTSRTLVIITPEFRLSVNNIRFYEKTNPQLGGVTIAEKEENKPRNFALRDQAGNESGVFTGKSPRQAALKAANRGVTDIRLRERGTKKVHIFQGERVQVDKPANAPSWMPDKIWKPKVKKVGIEKLE